jgi:hypothetical protein
MNKSESPTVFGRILAGLIGAAAGALAYFTWVMFGPMGPMGHASWPDRWSLHGQVKWFVIGGFVLGALGGWSFAQKLWSWAVGDLHSEATSLSTVAFVIIAVVVIVVFGIKHLVG